MSAKPSLLFRVLKVFVISSLSGGAVGVIAAVLMVTYISATSPQELRGDPGGWAFLFSVVWGGLGSAVGALIGVIAAIVVVIQGRRTDE